MEIRIDTDEDCDDAGVRLVLLAARLFLQGRFEDRRTLDEVDAGVPRSAGNCWEAARFLAAVLGESGAKPRDPYGLGGTWHAVTGWCSDAAGGDHRHCYVVWRSNGEDAAVADLTADQFGHAEIVLRSVDAEGRYAFKGDLDRGGQGAGQARTWLKAWRAEAAAWLAEAKGRVATLADAAAGQGQGASPAVGPSGRSPAP